MKRGSLVMGLVAVAAISAALYTVMSGRGRAPDPTAGAVKPNLSTSNAGTVQSIAHSLIGKQMPDVSLPGLDGKQHNLSEYRGKKIILTYWATW